MTHPLNEHRGLTPRIGKIAALYRAEVNRSVIKDAPMPPKRLSYLRRLKQDGMSLAQLLNRSAITNA